MSATTRMVLDSVRTLVIWGVSLGVGWQEFHALHLLGFAILVVGMCVYNDLIFGKYDSTGPSVCIEICLLLTISLF